MRPNLGFFEPLTTMGIRATVPEIFQAILDVDVR
jgi:hypothetical protein